MSELSSSPVYVVLGATGGIGRDVAHRLGRRGARLILGARSKDDLQPLADELGADAFPLDATDYDDVQAIVDYATEAHGRLNGLVNCVGSILIKPAHLTSIDEFEETLRLNLHSAFYAVKAGARAMMKEGGAIVLMASAVARKGLTNHEAIAAAKGGVVGLTRSAAATYARRDVRVNCIAPGLVDTPLAGSVLGSEAAREQSAKMHALGRIGRPEDVGRAIDWLLDGEASGWVTGQVIGIDGGLGTLAAG